MQMKTLRKKYKIYFGASLKLTRADVEAYVAVAKDYLTAKEPGLSGLCFYASRYPYKICPYNFWLVMSKVNGSVAKDWEDRRRVKYHPGGCTYERRKMVKALIVELSALVEQDKRKR